MIVTEAVSPSHCFRRYSRAHGHRPRLRTCDSPRDKGIRRDRRSAAPRETAGLSRLTHPGISRSRRPRRSSLRHRRDRQNDRRHGRPPRPSTGASPYRRGPAGSSGPRTRPSAGSARTCHRRRGSGTHSGAHVHFTRRARSRYPSWPGRLAWRRSSPARGRGEGQGRSGPWRPNGLRTAPVSSSSICLPRSSENSAPVSDMMGHGEHDDRPGGTALRSGAEELLAGQHRRVVGPQMRRRRASRFSIGL